ncbi:MAG: histidine kinase [Myxococcaceae bacterium]|nr:histidine kinase [Myxococcaceae bacterium]
MTPTLLRVLLTCLLCGLTTPGSADERDGAVLQMGTALRGSPLGRRIELLEDPGGALGIDDVLAPENASRFVRASAAAPSLGFTSSVYWLRFAVHNPSPKSERWLLELGYPLLDEVTLFVPRFVPGVWVSGFAARTTGDSLPFARRDVAYRNFVFSLEEPPSSLRTYYLRVRTSGTMNLPLVAWSMREFLEHQHLDWAALCIFYGVLLVMACYSACVYLFARQREYLPYFGYVVCMGFLQFTMAGHTFQFLLPRAPELVHRLLPASIAATMMFGTVVVRNYLPRAHWLSKLAGGVVSYCALLSASSFVLPYQLSVRLTNYSVLVLVTLATLYGFELLRVEGKSARLFVLGWGSAIIGALVSTLQGTGLLPQMFVTDWSMQIGCAVQLVLLSSALADKLETARHELSLAHGTLSQKLLDLSGVLVETELATARAERATQLKDQFLATMSHEFRTPLNPIINIPQEMQREFVPVGGACCTHCHARFELDENELLSSESRCSECEQPGTLVPESGVRYVGDPTRTRRYLLKIERSGVQLLRVVNGILDFSKLQAGHVELVPESFSTGPLVHGVAEQFREQARQKDLGITCVLWPMEHMLTADPQRVREVLAILLDNAIKYSERAGYVTMRAELSEGTDGSCYTFSVSDQGIGIDPAHFESIFESFEQVYKGNTRKYGGTGLGLSIARSLVRMHGGELTVCSEVGRGSTFRFTIPVHAHAASSRVPSRPLAAPSVMR